MRADVGGNKGNKGGGIKYPQKKGQFRERGRELLPTLVLDERGDGTDIRLTSGRTALKRARAPGRMRPYLIYERVYALSLSYARALTSMSALAAPIVSRLL